MARVIRRQGTCAFGHTVGDEVIFDSEMIQARICDHSLYRFPPKVFIVRKGADFPWLKENRDVSTHACRTLSTLWCSKSGGSGRKDSKT
ncbi:MAG: hypothetical protein R6X27_14220 [Candidatus Desulfacyla sp.]